MDHITKRQYQILVALGRGLSAKQIAAELGVDHRTVHFHTNALANRVGCHASQLLFRLGIWTINPDVVTQDNRTENKKPSDQ